MALQYTSLPVVNKIIRVGKQPDITAAWCGANPNDYNIVAFIKGIYKDVSLGAITSATQSLIRPLIPVFVKFNPSAFVGDGNRHIEFGRMFPKRYTPITKAGKPLGPVSWPHLNIITETDRTIERIHVGCSFDPFNFATFFSTYLDFQQLIKGLRGNAQFALEDYLNLKLTAILLADPTGVLYGDEDIARIFESVSPSPEVQQYQEEPSREFEDWKVFAKQIFTKYYSKSQKLWKNIQWYDTTFYSDVSEEMRKDDVYSGVAPERDKAKRFMQQLYTIAHGDSGEDEDAETTKALKALTRNQCLMAMYYAVKRAINIITKEASTKYWLGNNTGIQVFQTAAGLKRAQAEQAVVEGQEVGRHADSNNTNPDTTASFADGFKVTASLDDLVIVMNPEDYAELQDGISWTGPKDTRTISLDGWGVKTIIPVRSCKAGFVRLVDRRALLNEIYFQLNDVQAPAEELLWRFKTHMQDATTIFKNFAGCLFVPSAHFVASPELYDSWGLIGQTVEKKK